MSSQKFIRLGVNIDHVATVRNARGGAHPDPLRAALLAQQADADGITLHLREDRRHIRDADVMAIKQAIRIPLNFEMAATADMQKIALAIQPHACCIVPEKREERTTESGLDARAHEATLTHFIAPLKAAGIRVSLFIAPDETQVRAAARIGADIVEIHTGHYAEMAHEPIKTGDTLNTIRRAAMLATSFGIEVHAGHGLNYANVKPIAAITDIRELNIGHFLMGEAMMVGMEPAIRAMRALMDEARA